MTKFSDYLDRIDSVQQRAKLNEILTWITRTFPSFSTRIAWNQPMFTDHGTYIIGFSIAKQHISIAPEKAAMLEFFHFIAQAGYDQTDYLFRIRWDQPIDFSLLEAMIRFNVLDKAGCTTFWR
jgi:uncharacterized protein YdhG (YjbR/CyaY superfamily)